MSSCKEDISNRKFRNENYVFYQENGKAGKWLKINPSLENKLPKSHSTYFFPNGNRFAELEVLDSYSNRIIMYFDKENDSLTYTDKYDSDSIISDVYQNGYYRQYHSNRGQLQSEGLIENQMCQGQWKVYSKNGKTIEEIREWVNDTLHGIREVYWGNGNLKAKTNYIKGKQNGKTFHYYENGETKEISFLKDEKIHGESIRYFPNGKLESITNLWNGIKKDTNKFYYENEKIKQLEIINLDTITSSSSGITYCYYRNGNLEQEFYMANNMKNGKASAYFESGELKYTGFNENNLWVGQIKYFDQKGKHTKTMIAEKGIVIDSIIY